MSILKRPVAVHHLLFAAFPVLFLFSHNIGELSPRVVPAPLAVSVGAAAISFLLLNLFLRDSKKTALTISLFILLFFSYGHAHEAVKTLVPGPAALRIPLNAGIILSAVWAGLFLCGARLLVKTKNDLAVLTALCNATAALLVSISLVNICCYEFARSGSARDAATVKNTDKNGGSGHEGIRKPDIYYIVVDAYAGNDILKDVYGYDNSGFTEYLKEKGFYVAGGSASNYSRTGLSLASTLNMDYLDAFKDRIDPDSKDTLPVNNITRNGRVFDILRRRGYTIAALSSGCADSEIDSADIYIKPGWTPDEFQNMLIGTTPIPLLLCMTGSPDQYDMHIDRIIFELDRLADTGKMRRPFFIFAHLEIPHPPFVFGPHGEKLKPGLIFHVDDGDSLIRRGRLTRDRYVRGYIDQLIFTNQKLKKTLDAILSGSEKPPVIILQSDHGPRSRLSWESPEKTDFRECMSILNAYYLPDGGGKLLYGGITPVNTFRIIFNYYFGTVYPLLEDRSFFSTAKHPYRFLDVTGTVQKR